MRAGDTSNSDDNGAQFTVQLARVTERWPCIAAIRSAHTAPSQLHLVAKLRAHLVHYIVDGVVMCVIRSLEPIVDVCDAASASNSDGARQILVATTSGTVWRVALPIKPLGVLQHVLLQTTQTPHATHSSAESMDTPTQVLGLGLVATSSLTSQDDARGVHRGGTSCCVELVGEVPGVRSVLQRGDCIICTSVIAPSMLLWPRDASTAAPTCTSARIAVATFELLELEAEQSSCAIALRSSDSDLAHALVQWFAPSRMSVAAAEAETASPALLLLQGDMDGTVRYYVTSSDPIAAAAYGAGDDDVMAGSSSSAPLPLVGKLTEMDEPIQWLVSFTTVRTRCGVLVVGSRGNARVLLPLSLHSHAARSARDAGAVKTISITFGAPVQSIVFVAPLECFVYCASGRAHVFRAHDVVTRGSSGDEQSSAAPHTVFSALLPIPSGVVALAVHGDSSALSLVFASGRVVSMDANSVRRAINSVLAAPPTRESTMETFEPSETAATATAAMKHMDDGGDSSASRIKSLLQRIAHVSTTSTVLSAQSAQLDIHLHNLHAALVLLQQIEANGVHSLFRCHLELSLVATGSLARAKAVKLTCRIDASKLEMADALLACWLVSVHVRSRSQLVTSFVFPLRDALQLGPSPRHSSSAERTMLLGTDVLEHEDSGGVLFASCSLMFQPGTVMFEQQQQQRHDLESIDTGMPQAQTNGSRAPTSKDVNRTRGKSSAARALFSFAIPLVRDRAFYLTQLSELLPASDVPTSVTAIKAAFRQDQDASLPSTSLLMPSLSSTTGESGSSGTGSGKEQAGGSLLQGFQFWSALAKHWHDKAFAALWMRELQSSSQELLESQELQSLEQPLAAPPARNLDVAPPSRFTMVFPAFAVRELTVDHAVAVVRSAMGFPASMAQQLHASCRSQSGKFWIGLQTFSANVVVLRLALADGTILIDGEALRPLEVTVQCSSADDLSLMRALLLEGVPRCPGHEDMAMPLDDVFATLSLQAAEFRGLLDETEMLTEAITAKVATNLHSLERCSLCTDEVVRLLADLARAETQTLEVYWKSRDVLNKFVI